LQDPSTENKADSRPEGSQEHEIQSQEQSKPSPEKYYYVRFRTGTPSYSATSRLADLKKDDVVMTQTDHGPEPATIAGSGPPDTDEIMEGAETNLRTSYDIVRRANREEIEKFDRLMEREQEAFEICQSHIKKHQLAMKLTRVERFFNGSKIIFYFTAENRVDFRELVKDLVQEFRTRVEIRQIGVRHETKMVGGLGCCGRELCCSSFIKNFAPVSIKMAKEQRLPLNPAKISGVCNRLLCCLTYEYDTYHKLRKGMPKPGKTIVIDGIEHKVLQQNILQENITVVRIDEPDKQFTLTREEWASVSPPPPPAQPHAQKSPKSKGRRQRSRGKGRPDKNSRNQNKDDHQTNSASGSKKDQQ